MDEKSHNAERLLRKMQHEEESKHRGHLKIFFGYAAGVGKTYAMLHAAHDALAHGTDVLVGYIEPHTRPETMALLEGLTLLPNRVVKHGDIELREFDLDAALRLKPTLILVDELAHTNAPGSRHEKRYQDVDELLNAGIDVYTTINVQHIESLHDMVASITGVSVRERIPDSVFDRASQVEIVDIEPQDLIERLQSGKVYREAQAKLAINNFFTIENLTALREIALRRCADRVNSFSESTGLRRSEDYHTEEHILVCLSSSPSNPKIIRTAARMAQAFKGAFTGLYVETPDSKAMSEENQQRLRANMRLAEQLGAKIETVYGRDVPFQIAEFARLSGVSKIVIGRSAAAKGKYFGKQTLTEKLIATAPQLDIHIIPDATAEHSHYRAKRARARSAPGMDLLKSLGILVLASLVGLIFYYMGFEEANIITIYVLGVLITSVITTNRIYSLSSSLVSVLVFNYLFTEPRFSLQAYDKGYPVTFIIMFIAALLTSSLAVKLKEHAKQSALVAFRTKMLFEVNQSLQQAQSRDEILHVTANHLSRLLQKDVVIYAVEEGKLLEPQTFYLDPDEPKTNYCTETERAVALWVLKNNKHAGATTQTLSNAKCLYLAIRINQNVYGVIGIAADKTPPDTFEKSILLSILGECALALENEKNAREKKEAAILAQNEQLRANLLRAISHDLRTPLTSISGNASNFLSNGDAMDEETKRQLFTDIYDDSMWLINLVENLLSVTRLEEDHLNLNLNSELVSDVIEEALRHVNRKSVEHNLHVEQEDEFLLAKMDAKLIVQVIINLVDNAIKYTPVGSDICIRTRAEGKFAVISVSDNGDGISDDQKPKIFDMFYSGANKIADSRRSLGLGLSLCKSIVSAHGGTISVVDNDPKGTIFTFSLPIEEVAIHE